MSVSNLLTLQYSALVTIVQFFWFIAMENSSELSF